MMPLETYIKELLYRYNCVIVPEFGGFLTHNQSAQIHAFTHTFYPPKKTISFNQQLQTNDGLLANYIAEVDKIPYDAALEKIKDNVTQMKEYLYASERIVLSDIGSLIFNNEGNIIFEPIFQVNYLLDAFGLQHFNSEVIDRAPKTIVPLVAVTENDIIQKTPEKVTESHSNVEVKATPVKRVVWPKYAATAALFLGLTSIVTYNHLNNKVINYNQNAAQNAQKQIDTKVQEATFVINAPLPAVTFSLTQNSGKYHIVAGAYSVKENAERKMRHLKKMGFNPKNLGQNSKGLHVVAYGSFTTLEEAKRDLVFIKRQYNPDAWIMIKTLK